ncbi:MAG: VOC family protein, partial [Bacteroidota bacterium]
GLCGGLHTATLITDDLDAYKSFYVDALGLTLDGPFTLTEKEEATQRLLWQIPDSITWTTYLLHRPAVPNLIQLRVLVLDQTTPMIHDSYSSREVGPFSLGFPNGNQEELDRSIREKGYGSMAPLQEGTVNRPDGSSYRYIETIYQGPDSLHIVGIERKDGMSQLAPIDTNNLQGGPGYSAMVVEDSDSLLAFLTDVLDLELRADRTWNASPGSALGIPEGTPFRFALVYAKGMNHNHLLFLDYQDDEFIYPAAAPRPPNRGLAMWTFQTTDLNEVIKRAKTFGTPVVSGPTSYRDPLLGTVSAITFLAPNGFLIEVFEQK